MSIQQYVKVSERKASRIISVSKVNQPLWEELQHLSNLEQTSMSTLLFQAIYAFVLKKREEYGCQSSLCERK